MPPKKAAKQDWFRHTTWTAEDQREFFTRLERARAHNRSQYLAIQADAIKDEYPDEALRLCQMLLEKYPDRIWLALTYSNMAECYVAKSDEERAVEYFRKALQQEEAFPNVKTNAFLIYAAYVLENAITQYYAEISDILLKRPYERMLFPCQRYTFHGAIAIICDYCGQPEEAAQHARLALQFAEQEHSGFRYHAKLGLVRHPSHKTMRQLKRIALRAE